jgi:hypothetical protein
MNDMAAWGIDADRDLLEVRKALADLDAAVRRDKEEHAAAATGSEEFGSDGSGLASAAVDVLDFGIGDGGVEGALEVPGFVEQFAELSQIAAGGEDGVAFVDHVAHARKGETLGIEVADVVAGDVGGAALDAGMEQEEMVFDEADAVRGEGDGVDNDVLTGAELDELEAADGGEDLVLAADGFAEDVLFEMDRLDGEFEGTAGTSLEGVERVEKADDEGGGGAESGVGGEFAGVVDLDIIGDAAVAEAFAEGGVLDFLEGFDAFHFAVGDTDGVIEETGVEAGDGEVGGVIDGSAEDGSTAVLLEVIGVIGAAAEEADAEWGLSDDHAKRPDILSLCAETAGRQKGFQRSRRSGVGALTHAGSRIAAGGKSRAGWGWECGLF